MISAWGSFLLPSPSGLSLPENLGDTLRREETKSGKVKDPSPSLTGPTRVISSESAVHLVLDAAKSEKCPVYTRAVESWTGEVVPQRSVRQCRRKSEVRREHSMTAAFLEMPRDGGSSLVMRLNAIAPGWRVQDPAPCYAHILKSPCHEESYRSASSSTVRHSGYTSKTLLPAA